MWYVAILSTMPIVLTVLHHLVCSLVRSLEARVAELEAQTLAFREAPQNVPNAMASIIGRATISVSIPSSTSYLRSRISSGLIFQPSCPPLAIVRDRGYAPSEHPQPNSDGQPPSSGTLNKFSSNSVIDLGSIPSSAIERIVENYASTHLPQYPCISPAMLEDIVDRAKDKVARDKRPRMARELSTLSGPDHFEYFVLFIVLAISSMTLTWKDDEQARRASESFYNSAIAHLHQLEDDSEIKALQISLLLAHYAQMCPERLDNWTCIANAVRIVMNLGMFRKCPDTMPEQQVRQRTELFWVTYGMERSLCTNLRLPLSFPEDVITASVRMCPSPCCRSSPLTLVFQVDDPSNGRSMSLATSEDAIKRSSANQIRKYRKLETEVHRVLHLEEDLDRFGHATVDSWIEDIEARLRNWYATAQCFTRHNMLEFKHIQFHHLRARIHRPTPRLRLRTSEDRRMVLEASRILIEDYLGQQHRRRLFYPWHGVHILFETALIALEACWSSRDWQPLRGQARQMLEEYIPQCLKVIIRIGERWHGAAACGDRLKPLVDRVRSAFLQDPGPFPIYGDISITEEIESLLFSDRPLIWNHQYSGADLFSLENSPLGVDFPMAEDLELFQWDPTWSIVPAEPAGEASPGHDPLMLSSEALTISSLLSLSAALDT